tara:strand:- start:1596 stop:2015 length:420 start_codon:yes stop_codon:yes gene_type:complete
LNINRNNLSAIFKGEGLRLTQQRIAVWDEIRHSKEHLDAEDIYENIKNKDVHISRATVYRTIDVLVKNNLLRKMNMGDGRNRYEIKDEDHHHDHMICVETGKIIEFYDNDLEKLQEEIAKKHGYKVIRHVHQLFVKPLK